MAEDSPPTPPVSIPSTKGIEDVSMTRCIQMQQQIQQCINMTNNTPPRAGAAAGTTAAITPSPSSSAALDNEQHSIQTEKEAVTLVQKTGGKSIVWNFFRDYSIKAQDAEGQPPLTITLQKLVAAKDPKQRASLYICELCYDDKSKRLIDAVKSLPDGQASNGRHHLKHCHLDELTAAEGKKPGSSSRSQPDVQQLSLLQALSNSKPKRSCDVLLQFEYKLFEVINDNGIAYTLPQKENFRRFIRFIINNALVLKTLQYEKTGKFRLREVQLLSFNLFRSFVTKRINAIREYYIETTGRQQPFLIVSHDDWDGNNRDIRGLSVMFGDPRTFEYTQVAVCLSPPNGKKSIEICNDSMRGLDRYGIATEDLYAPVNDTTNPAVKAGKLICHLTNEKGSCNMHVLSIILKRILGLLVRTEDKVEIDPLPAFVKLEKLVRKLVKTLMNGNHFPKYKKMNESNARSVLKISLPTDVRAAGVTLLFEALISSKYSIDLYGGKTDEIFRCIPSPNEWQQICEATAIIRPIAEAIFNVQTNRFGHGGELLVELARILKVYRRGLFKVVDLEAGAKQAWNGNVPYSELPKKLMTTDSARSTARALTDRSPLPMMSPLSKQLVKRGVSNIAHYYFADDEFVNEQTLRTFGCNPAMTDLGQRELRLLQNEQDFDRCSVDSLMLASKEAIIEQIEKVTEGMDLPLFLGDTSASARSARDRETLVTLTSESHSFFDDDDDDDDDDALAHLDRANKKPRFEEETEDGPKKTDKERIKEEVDKLFSLQLNWPAELRDQARIPKDEIDWDRVKKGDSLYVSKIFDIGKWWYRKGRFQSPLVALVAPRILALPSSNGYQERIFSICTFFDSKLRNRLGPERFEMAVLLTVNRIWMEEMIDHAPITKESVDNAAKEVLAFFGVDDLDTGSEDQREEMDTGDVEGDDDGNAEMSD